MSREAWAWMQMLHKMQWVKGNGASWASAALHAVLIVALLNWVHPVFPPTSHPITEHSVSLVEITPKIIPPKPIDEPKPPKLERTPHPQPHLRPQPILPTTQADSPSLPTVADAQTQAVPQERSEVSVADAGPNLAPQMGALNEVSDPGYYTRLSKAIGERVSYPVKSLRAGEEGQVRLRFHLLRDGTITHIEVASTSGSYALDQAALEAVRSLGHFDALPSGVGANAREFVVEIPVDFRLDGG